MVGIKHFMFFLLAFILLAGSARSAEITQESAMFKGYFGESLVDDIWLRTGRTSLSDKINPVLNGPDKIYRLADGTIEIHEVKSYTSWAGRNAMKTTIDGKPSYELSREWVENWIQKTLADSKCTASEKAMAQEVQKAVQAGKCTFRFDEVNLSTRQIRFSEVFQKGAGDVELHELAGPTRLKYFERFYSKKTREFAELKAGNVEKLLQKPQMTEWSKGHPLSRADFEKLAEQRPGLTPAPGIITPEGRLLVAVRTGGKMGLLVFMIDGGLASYSYVKGDINCAEYEEKLWDAAIKGTAVGGCTAVAVFLGASAGGPVVAAVSVGAYLITDQILKEWHENQKRKFLTADDLKAWGFELDSVLALPVDSNLVLPKDTTLEMPTDSILEIPTDSILDL